MVQNATQYGLRARALDSKWSNRKVYSLEHLAQPAAEATVAAGGYAFMYPGCLPILFAWPLVCIPIAHHATAARVQTLMSSVSWRRPEARQSDQSRKTSLWKSQR